MAVTPKVAKESEPVGVLSAEYVEVSKLFSPVEESIQPEVTQIQKQNQTKLAASTPLVEEYPLVLKKPYTKVPYGYKQPNSKGFAKAAKLIPRVSAPMTGPHAKEKYLGIEINQADGVDIKNRVGNQIAIWHHYLRDRNKQGDISLDYRSTKRMIVDGLTKPSSNPWGLRPKQRL